MKKTKTTTTVFWTIGLLSWNPSSHEPLEFGRLHTHTQKKRPYLFFSSSGVCCFAYGNVVFLFFPLRCTGETHRSVGEPFAQTNAGRRVCVRGLGFSREMTTELHSPSSQYRGHPRVATVYTSPCCARRDALMQYDAGKDLLIASCVTIYHYHSPRFRTQCIIAILKRINLFEEKWKTNTMRWKVVYSVCTHEGFPVMSWADRFLLELSIIWDLKRGRPCFTNDHASWCAWFTAFCGFPILAQERARPYWRQCAHAQSWPEILSFSGTDSWRRPSGGLLTPSQPKRKRRRVPSSAHLCPLTGSYCCWGENGGGRSWARDNNTNAQMIITHIE